MVDPCAAYLRYCGDLVEGQRAQFGNGRNQNQNAGPRRGKSKVLCQSTGEGFCLPLSTSRLLGVEDILFGGSLFIHWVKNQAGHPLKMQHRDLEEVPAFSGHGKKASCQGLGRTCPCWDQ